MVETRRESDGPLFLGRCGNLKCMFPQLLENGVLEVDYENYAPWPYFRALGSKRLGGLWRAHFLKEVLDRDDLDCAAWRAPIPARILRSLRSFPEGHCELIEMAQAAPDFFHRLTDRNPAMALLAATYWCYCKLGRVPEIDERCITWENLDAAQLLHYARFPTTKSFLRVLAKVPVEHVYTHHIDSLRAFWAVPEKRRVLQHLPAIRGENICLLSYFPPILDPGIHRLAAEEPRFEEFSIFEIVSDLSIRRELLCWEPWPYRNRLHSWTQLFAAYNKFLRKTNCLPETLPQPPLDGVEVEELEIVPLRSRTALRRESAEMCNCIEDYCPSICLGKHYAYKLLKPERATVLIKRELQRWIIEEAMIHGNAREVSPPVMKLLRQWIKDALQN